MFGFREPVLGPTSPTRGRVRLSGFGHVGLGGSVALCDPASGLAFAMVTNKVDCLIAVLVLSNWLMCRIYVVVRVLLPLPVALEARADGTRAASCCRISGGHDVHPLCFHVLFLVSRPNASVLLLGSTCSAMTFATTALFLVGTHPPPLRTTLRTSAFGEPCGTRDLSGGWRPRVILGSAEPRV